MPIASAPRSGTARRCWNSISITEVVAGGCRGRGAPRGRGHGRCDPPPCGRDRHTRQRRYSTCCQSSNGDDSNSVFFIGNDPVQAGVVACLVRPGGNMTGVTSLNVEVTPKRLRLLHELVPKAAPVAVLVNPANTTATEIALRDLHEAAPIIGLQIQVLKATTIVEIDSAFAMLARERPDALFVGPDGFFASRRVQFAILAARERIDEVIE